MGKKLAVLGFAVLIVIGIISIPVNFMRAMQIAFPVIRGISMIMNFASIAAKIVIAMGFALIFLQNRNFMNFLIGGDVFLSALYSIFFGRIYGRIYDNAQMMAMVPIILSAICLLYYLGLAIKAARVNILISAALVGAYVYILLLQNFINQIISRAINPYIGSAVVGILSVLCTCVAFVEVMADNN